MRPWILLALLGVSACEDKGIGLPCQIENLGDGGVSAPETTQVITEAVECPESICIQMAKRPPTKAGEPQPQAYCTALCSSDSDCEGGENCWHVDPDNPSRRTKMRYRCVKPIVISTDAKDPEAAGGLFCEGICICEADARRQTNPVVMVPEAECARRKSNDQLCDWEVKDPPQCVE